MRYVCANAAVNLTAGVLCAIMFARVEVDTAAWVLNGLGVMLNGLLFGYHVGRAIDQGRAENARARDHRRGQLAHAVAERRDR